MAKSEHKSECGSPAEGLATLDTAAIEGLIAVESQGVANFLEKQVKKFLNKLPENLQQFYGEINRSEFTAARETIHKLAGYAGMVGAQALRLQGLQIETAIDQGNGTLASQLAETLPVIWQATVRDFETLLQRRASPG